MANIIEQDVYEEGIYQLETTDRIMGGVDGTSNKQAKQLANRTKYIKTILDASTNLATPNTLAKRSATGTMKTSTPVAEDDIANKGYADSRIVNNNTGNSTTEAMSQSSAKAYTDTAESDAKKWAVPIGMIYVQYPFQSTPSDLWGGTWSDISDTYEGAYFRALGGDSADWEVFQAEGIPNFVMEFGVSLTLNDAPAGNVFLHPVGSSGDVSRVNNNGQRARLEGSYASPIYGASTHVTPKSYAIKIWKKTAY